MSGCMGSWSFDRQYPQRGPGTIRTARQTLAAYTSGAALTALDVLLFVGSSEGLAPSLYSLVYL